MTLPEVHLKPHRDESLRRQHPWVFSGAVARVTGAPGPGDVVEVLAADGSWRARGFYNPHSEVRVRAATWDPEERLDEAWLHRGLEQALARRDQLGLPAVADAYRLVFIESDRLPGLIADRYGDFIVMQLNNHAMERRRETIAAILTELLQPRGLFERSDDEVRRREGLEPRVGCLRGEEPPARVPIVEHGLHFTVDVRGGHKTGFYLDQRENRQRAAPFLRGQVLNAFAYSGAFAVYAARGGAEQVVNLDSSAEALALAAHHAELNGCADRCTSLRGNAFEVMRSLRDQGTQFDAVVLDPPRFAKSKRAVQQAARGYKDLNLLALKLLRPGGFLVTCSCSGLVSAELFQQIVFGAALDAGREVRIVQRLTQGGDHPVLLTFPEADYLKGLTCQVA